MNTDTMYLILQEEFREKYYDHAYHFLFSRYQKENKQVTTYEVLNLIWQEHESILRSDFKLSTGNCLIFFTLPKHKGVCRRLDDNEVEELLSDIESFPDNYTDLLVEE